MGPKYPPDFCDNETLAALTQTYREVWKTVVLKDPFRDFGKDEKLRQNIAVASSSAMAPFAPNNSGSSATFTAMRRVSSEGTSAL